VASDDDLGLYRSLSTFSVLSLILGLLSVLSFAPTPFFILIIPPAAIVTGLIALRQIRSAPEVWTGTRLAQLGIGLAVVCTGGSLGENYYTSVRIARYGRAVADRFLDKLKKGDVEAAFWLTSPREQRMPIIGKSIDELPPQVLERYGSFWSEIEPHASKLTGAGVIVEFERVERAASEHGTEYAAIVYHVHSPQGDSRMLIVAAGMLSPDTHEHSWMIRQHKFDYTSGTFAAPTASGHGHSH
jgi:hypothetical protein